MVKRIRINTIWQGKVGIREKQVLKALENKQDLLFVRRGEKMLIPYQFITNRIVGKSKESFLDRFSNERHYLMYFDWKPTIIQKSLI